MTGKNKQTGRDPLMSHHCILAIIKIHWVLLHCTWAGFSQNSSLNSLKAYLSPLSCTSLARCAHVKLNCVTASFLGIFVMDYDFLTMKEIVAIKEVLAVIMIPEISFSLLCFPTICSLNPLKTCAWLPVCIWEPLKTPGILPAPSCGLSATTCTTGNSVIQHHGITSQLFLLFCFFCLIMSLIYSGFYWVPITL